jgi:multidrug transporter EmrE-like cation transporter
MAYIWLIVGGVLEPSWVFAMKKYNDHRNLQWAIITSFCIITSPFFLSLAIKEGVPVGTAYAVWTGIGAICTTALGILLYKESKERKQLFFIFIIIAGAVGLGWGGI